MTCLKPATEEYPVSPWPVVAQSRGIIPEDGRERVLRDGRRTGAAAYVVEQADGSWILVCRSGAPFEIRVDARGKEPARAAAKALARQVLAAG